MAKKSKYILIILLVMLLAYIGLSLLILEGRLVYTTSFNESTIEASKSKDLFVTDNLEVFAEGDSLLNWKDRFEIWTNKRYEIKYFGVLLHWTYTKPEWRYLNVRFKDKRLDDDWKVKYPNQAQYWGCCNRESTIIGDTVATTFYRFKDDTKLGTLKVVIQ